MGEFEFGNEHLGPDDRRESLDPRMLQPGIDYPEGMFDNLLLSMVMNSLAREVEADARLVAMHEGAVRSGWALEQAADSEFDHGIQHEFVLPSEVLVRPSDVQDTYVWPQFLAKVEATNTAPIAELLSSPRIQSMAFDHIRSSMLSYYGDLTDEFVNSRGQLFRGIELDHVGLNGTTRVTVWDKNYLTLRMFDGAGQKEVRHYNSPPERGIYRRPNADTGLKPSKIDGQEATDLLGMVYTSIPRLVPYTELDHMLRQTNHDALADPDKMYSDLEQAGADFRRYVQDFLRREYFGDYQAEGPITLGMVTMNQAGEYLHVTAGERITSLGDLQPFVRIEADWDNNPRTSQAALVAAHPSDAHLVKVHTRYDFGLDQGRVEVRLNSSYEPRGGERRQGPNGNKLASAVEVKRLRNFLINPVFRRMGPTKLVV